MSRVGSGDPRACSRPELGSFHAWWPDCGACDLPTIAATAVIRFHAGASSLWRTKRSAAERFIVSPVVAYVRLAVLVGGGRKPLVRVERSSGDSRIAMVGVDGGTGPGTRVRRCRGRFLR